MKNQIESKGLIIGIDPDLDKSGFAVIEGGKFTHISCKPIWNVFDTLNYYGLTENWMVYIEDGRLTKGTWHKHGQKNVGKNQAICKLLVEFCKAHSIPYTQLKPAGYSDMFKNVDVFKAATGWTERTNEDARAAAAMIYKFMK
jgi:hypothetical protein